MAPGVPELQGNHSSSCLMGMDFLFCEVLSQAPCVSDLCHARPSDPEKDPSSAFNTLTFLLQGRTSFFFTRKPRAGDNGIHHWVWGEEVDWWSFGAN